MTEPTSTPRMRLDHYENGAFSRGASRLTELTWIVLSGIFFSSWLPGSGWRCILLRAFGAQIGKGVVIKPRVLVKFPWRLNISDHVWIGERVWIDNLDEVKIGAHSCISQGAYLCTGSHDWADPRFGLVTKSITIGSSCWVGARASLAPGTVMEDGSVIAMHSLGHGTLSANMIYRNACPIEQRPRSEVKTQNGSAPQ